MGSRYLGCSVIIYYIIVFYFFFLNRKPNFIPFIWKVKNSLGSISIFLLEFGVLTNMLKYLCSGDCKADADRDVFLFLKCNAAMLLSPIITPLSPKHNMCTCLANSEFDQKLEVYLCDKQTYNLSILNYFLSFL